MKVIINGHPEIVYPDKISLKQLVSRLGRVNVITQISVNDIVIPLEDWKVKIISDFDRIDYV